MPKESTLTWSRQGVAVLAEIVRLRQHRNDPRARAVRSAAVRSLVPVLTKAERRADRRVRLLRTEMQASTELVTIDTGEVYTVGDLTLRGSKPQRWTRFLYRVEQLLGAERVVEMGTNAGISGSALALALPSNGHLWTLDVNLATQSAAAFRRAGLADRVTVVSGYFDDTLDLVLNEADPVGLVFIDGHHEEESSLRYFHLVLPRVAKNALVIFDDIHWSQGMEQAWHRLRTHPRVHWSVDLQSLGVVAV